MADIRPFRGLRFQPEVAGSAAALLCPPFDVISLREQRGLYELSPYNIVRMEFGEKSESDTLSDNRYTRAAASLAEWLRDGALAPESSAAFYAYEQEFDRGEKRLSRRGLFARVRLHEWDERVVLPHEHTLAKPKEDRLQLLRALRVNLSPVLGLYRDPEYRVTEALRGTEEGNLVLDARDPTGQRHRLFALADARLTGALSDLFRDKTVYVIDGHHRYETALAYRVERRSAAPDWTGEESENFVLMCLIAADDPGLVVLPTHRLVRLPAVPPDFSERLRETFVVEHVGGAPGEWPALEARLAAAGQDGIAFAVVGDKGKLRLVARARETARLDGLMAGAPPLWRRLDTAVLQRVVLGEMLGISGADTTESGQQVEFTHDGAAALRGVESGECDLAFLLNATPADQVLAIADAGERMPQKTTFFYPKVPTGLVMNPLDG